MNRLTYILFFRGKDRIWFHVGSGNGSAIETRKIGCKLFLGPIVKAAHSFFFIIIPRLFTMARVLGENFVDELHHGQVNLPF